MSKHIGNIGDKISAQVKLVNEFQYTDYKFNRYSGTDHFTYIMKDADGNVYVWKTTSFMGYTDDAGEWFPIRKGDTLVITGKVKEHSEYNGVKQTVLTRCKCSLVESAETVKQEKREKQIQSLEFGDFIWEMPYRQYKEHYSDCETVIDSYDNEERTIKVIIRAGRLKASGVRGQHYSYYKFEAVDGRTRIYKAVSEATAIKQLAKEFPDYESWEHVDTFRPC